jgi:hypothetical protein
MSSANNHRRRSRRSYEKRVSTMNTLQRKTVVKKTSTQVFGYLNDAQETSPKSV